MPILLLNQERTERLFELSLRAMTRLPPFTLSLSKGFYRAGLNGGKRRAARSQRLHAAGKCLVCQARKHVLHIVVGVNGRQKRHHFVQCFGAQVGRFDWVFGLVT